MFKLGEIESLYLIMDAAAKARVTALLLLAEAGLT
ncbi:hypothetical protein CF149_02544 [Pseudomonas psychrophila]|nr:hypothetical protein CF149_02544 [Pseudomonas psychrophila]